MKNMEHWIAFALLVLSLLISAISSYTATQRALTNIESVLLQSFSLIAGLVGSFIFGKQSAKDAAREIIKPHARSAFRRLLSLFESLSRVGREIENCQTSAIIDIEKITLARLEAIVIEQLATADDALEDWRDIVPEDVEEIIARLTKNRIRNNNE
jgi:hypothetical protein